MTSEKFEERSPQLETRVAALEAEMAQMKKILSDLPPQKAPWWLKVAGSFESDPTFDDAMRFGREWRESAE